MKESTALWDFALALYSSPGVEETVLQLQDQANANVNILLWACWLQQRKIALSESALVNAEAAIADWDQTVVQVLRHLRRQLKVQEAGSELIADLRLTIKSAELLAERHCLDLLEALPTVAPQIDEPDNLSMYLDHLGAGEDISALRLALSGSGR